MNWLFLAALCLVGLAVDARKSYEGYQVLETAEPLTALSAAAMSELQAASPALDFWAGPAVGRKAAVMSPPGEHLDTLKDFLGENGISFEIFVEDVQKQIDLVASMGTGPKVSQNPRYNLDWDDYYDFDDFNEFIDELASEHDYVTTESIGSSFEGRDMRVVKIEKAGPGARNIWIDGELGVEDDKCSDVYPGGEPLSDAESRNMFQFYNSLEPVPEVAVCLHSYGWKLLYPYSYDYNQFPDNIDEIVSMCEDAVDALNSLYNGGGHPFECLNGADLSPASGASDDYFTSIGTRFVYAPELRGLGFNLPAEEIVPSGEEMWAAVAAIFDRLLEEDDRK